MNKKKVNEIVVEKIPGVERYKDSHNALFRDNNPNIYLLAKRKTGKTTVIHHILKTLTNPDTIVIFFCSQLYKDKSYMAILQDLKRRGVPFIMETSFIDAQGENQLKALVQHLKLGGDSKWLELDGFRDQNDISESSINPVDPAKIIIVIDDMSKETRYETNLFELLKANDHAGATVIISTQNKSDLPPQAIQQFTYVLAFSKIPLDKLKDLHRDLGLTIDFKKFLEIYSDATGGVDSEGLSHDFLYIDTLNNTFRKNFNLLFDI